MSFRNRTLIALSASFLACAAAAPRQPDSADTPGAQPRGGVLLFRNGRVIEGRISQTETHYIVARSAGQISVSKDDVEMVAQDLEDAFRYKSTRINERDADEHMRLAEWCLRVNLRAHAIEEAERCVELSPSSTRAKGLLATLRGMRAAGARSARAANDAGARSASSQSALVAPSENASAQSLSSDSNTVGSAVQKDLSSALVSKFTLQIQPILLRSCGTAGCHDSSHSGPLVLQRSAAPNARLTGQNLHSVLALVDSDDPEHSLLLTRATSMHGAERRSEPALSVRDAAYATLVDWVRVVAGKPASGLATAGDVRSSRRTSHSSVAQAARAKPAAQTPPQSNSATASGRARVTSVGDSATGPQVEPLPEPSSSVGDSPSDDPFDPEIFNRQFHPSGGGQQP